MNDICVGNDRYIHFGEIGSGTPQRIDEYLPRLMRVLDALEIHCISDCCGLNAFSFLPDEITRAIAPLAVEEHELLRRELEAAVDDIDKLPSDTIDCGRMNQIFRKDVFLQLLAHIRESIL